jgi:hypothetical protein
MVGTQLAGSWIAGEPMPLNEFEQNAFFAGYSSLVKRLPADRLEQAVTVTTLGMFGAGFLSYAQRIAETRQRRRPAPQPARPQPAPQASAPAPGGNGHGPSAPVATGNPYDELYTLGAPAGGEEPEL